MNEPITSTPPGKPESLEEIAKPCLERTLDYLRAWSSDANKCHNQWKVIEDIEKTLKALTALESVKRERQEKISPSADGEAKDQSGLQVPEMALHPFTHVLKCWPEFFGALLNGSKTFEVRKNDRGFKTGDELELHEFIPFSGTFTGRSLTRRVTYILEGSGTVGTQFGVQGGYVVMALQDAREASDAVGHGSPAQPSKSSSPNPKAPSADEAEGWEYLCADGNWRGCLRLENQRTGYATIESQGVQHVVPIANIRKHSPSVPEVTKLQPHNYQTCPICNHLEDEGIKETSDDSTRLAPQMALIDAFVQTFRFRLNLEVGLSDEMKNAVVRYAAESLADETSPELEWWRAERKRSSPESVPSPASSVEKEFGEMKSRQN